VNFVRPCVRGHKEKNDARLTEIAAADCHQNASSAVILEQSPGHERTMATDVHILNKP